MLLRKSLLAAFFAVFAASASHAATILYDFEENLGNNSTSLSYSESGLGLTVTAAGDRINRGNSGLGVRGNPEGGRLGLGESLTFTFAQGVYSFSARIFESGAEDELFRFAGFGQTLDLTAEGGGSAFTTVTFISDTPMTTFTISGLEPNASGNRGVRVGSVEVSTTPVPLPAAGGLMLLAIAGLGLHAQRKKP